MRVLIVDDDAMLRAMLVTVLEGEGFETASACHGAEAVARITAGWQPAVMLLDVLMPVMTGPDVCAWLAAHVRPEDRPHIIIMTATPSNLLSAPGVQAVITKPFDIDQMVALVRREGAASAGITLAATA
jgi:two-component system alkaline phosphatase synthesis response regulator PhoP